MNNLAMSNTLELYVLVVPNLESKYFKEMGTGNAVQILTSKSTSHYSTKRLKEIVIVTGKICKNFQLYLRKHKNQ